MSPPESDPVVLSFAVRHGSRSKIETLLCGLQPTERLPSRFPFPRVSSEMSDPDRRRAPRIALQQAVSLVIGNGGHEVPAVTENLSSAGVLLYADQLIREGSEIDGASGRFFEWK